MITLFGHRHSQPSRAVEVTLIEMGIPYKLHEIDFTMGETRMQWFLEMNPNHTIPVLRDGETVLYESHAIMRYLCRKKSAHAGDNISLYPFADVSRCAVIDQIMSWHHANVRQPSSDMFHYLISIHKTLPMLKYELQDLQMRPLQKKLRTALKTINECYLDDSDEPVLCTPGGGRDKITLADITVGCELYQLLCAGYTFDGYPRVRRWLTRTLAERDSFRKTSDQVIELGKEIHDQTGKYLDLDAFSAAPVGKL